MENSEDWVTCFLCDSARINLQNDGYHEFQSQKICNSCMKTLQENSNFKGQANLSPSDCTIPQDSEIVDKSFPVCNNHSIKCKLFCSKCIEAICISCLSQHKFHLIESVIELARISLKALHQIEFCAYYCEVNSTDEESNNAAITLKLDVIGSYKAIKDLNATSIAKDLSIACPRYDEVLENLNPDFIGLSLDEKYKLVREGRSIYTNTNLLHWIEWNDRTVHMLDLATMARSTHMFADGFIAPYYVRSALVAPTKIFMCGGRLDIATLGLKSAWIVHTDQNYKVEQLPDMFIGRSNHWVLYYADYVYVITGCDSNNEFTNKCERLNLRTRQWEMIASTNEIRDTSTAIAKDDNIYIFGGRSESTKLTKTIEKYIVGINSWVVLNVILPFETSVEGAVLLPGTSREILIFAGQDAGGKPLNKVAKVNVDTESAYELEPMPSKGGCVVNEVLVFGNKVYSYIFKGYNSRSLETWDLTTEEWKTEAQS